jgi:hypothetical protein
MLRCCVVKGGLPDERETRLVRAPARLHGRQEAFVHKERDDPRSEQLLHGLEAHLRQHMKQALAHEQAIDNERMQVGMEVEVLAEGVNGHDQNGQPVGRPSVVRMNYGRHSWAMRQSASSKPRSKRK